MNHLNQNDLSLNKFGDFSHIDLPWRIHDSGPWWLGEVYIAIARAVSASLMYQYEPALKYTLKLLHFPSKQLTVHTNKERKTPHPFHPLFVF